MHKAFFFLGSGTSFFYNGKRKEGMELYPGTVPALRFLSRRGFSMFLVTPFYHEYKAFCSSLKDKTFPVYYWDSNSVDYRRMLARMGIVAEKSFCATDGPYAGSFFRAGCKVILVLTGRGLLTLEGEEKNNGCCFYDICKDIYAAAFCAVPEG